MHKNEIPGFQTLVSLALDVRWSWNHEADALWQQLDLQLWSQTHNPWVILQTMATDKLQQKLADPQVRTQIDALEAAREAAHAAPTWFSGQEGAGAVKGIAYFSMEFMLTEALPIYVGGLGNVAGDQLKAASDLGVPVTGIGLLYQQGYFRQVIDANGNQQAYYPYNDPGQLPVKPLFTENGEWLRIQVPMPNAPLWLRVWEVTAGRVKLFLLDSNDPANPPFYRGITSQIYGGDSTMRLQQEIVLGIGGWRVLAALQLQPDVCHLNEGHAALAILERTASFMVSEKVSFDTAFSTVRAGNLFTTHTAVAAGFDHFDPWLIATYLGTYAAEKLQLSVDQLLALGRQNPADGGERFNMAYLAINGSGAVNAVSRLHGEVSKGLFQPLFNRWNPEDIPVGYVTNGIHVPSWESRAAGALWAQAGGEARWQNGGEQPAAAIQQAPASALWTMRQQARKSLVDYVRRQSGNPALFDEHTLTIGFARRFVPYKRPDLLLRDPNRLVRLLTNYQQPVQLVIAGKAPPTDEQGKSIIRHWLQFIRDYNMSAHVVFLPDYDMLMAAHMTGGVDVWLNTPRRPWEACGTSGMKVLVNGGINLSELDGWWAEAYTPQTGWALGDGLEHHEDEDHQDALEAEDLYATLEQHVLPSFYQRNADQVPEAWVEMMRRSMAVHTPAFSANRAVREYTLQYYLPCAHAYQQRAADHAAVGRSVAQWRKATDRAWSRLEIGETKVKQEGGEYVFEVPVFLADLSTDAVKVMLYADAVNNLPRAMHELQIAPCPEKTATVPAKPMQLYSGRIPIVRAATDYTVCLQGKHAQAAVPLENRNIYWQH